MRVAARSIGGSLTLAAVLAAVLAAPVSEADTRVTLAMRAGEVIELARHCAVFGVHRNPLGLSPHRLVSLTHRTEGAAQLIETVATVIDGDRVRRDLTLKNSMTIDADGIRTACGSEIDVDASLLGAVWDRVVAGAERLADSETEHGIERKPGAVTVTECVRLESEAPWISRVETTLSRLEGGRGTPAIRVAVEVYSDLLLDPCGV